MENQETINQWCNQRFGIPVSPKPPMLRVIDEVVEASMAVGITLPEIIERVTFEYNRQANKPVPPHIDELASEIAGIIIVLNRVAHAANIDINQAIEDEMAKNRKRHDHKGDR